MVNGSQEFTSDEKKSIFEAQANKDKSDTCRYMELECKALNATNDEREVLWKSFLDPKNPLSLRDVEH